MAAGDKMRLRGRCGAWSAAEEIVGRERRALFRDLIRAAMLERNRAGASTPQTLAGLAVGFTLPSCYHTVMTAALLILALLNLVLSASPQNAAQVRCGQSAAEQDPLLREVVDKRYTLRRIEFAGNETIRDYVLRRRVVLREGDFFSQRNLARSLLSLNKLKKFYPLAMKDVIVQLDKADKLVDVTFCFRERHAGPQGASSQIFGPERRGRSL